MRYIRHYNRAPKPIKWTYRNPNHRIYTDTISPVTGHYSPEWNDISRPVVRVV